MKCRRCSRAALYLVPGFVHEERTWCTRSGEWRGGCKKGRRGKPKRAVLDVYVTIDGLAAVDGCDGFDALAEVTPYDD